MRLEEDLVIRRSRPTMISAKYRAREERRRLLKISAGKLRRIDDPEASLCRSVLINNAVRRLQRESRDEKTRNYGLPLVKCLDESVKENNISGNRIIDITDSEMSSRKRLGGEGKGEFLNPKRQRHDDMDLQDDVLNDFYILPSPSRLLSHIDISPQEISNHHHTLDYSQERLSITNTSAASAVAAGLGTISEQSLSSMVSTTDLFGHVLGTSEHSMRTNDLGIMEIGDVEHDRICDFTRFTDSAKSLEERLVELQSLDDHFDLAKFERNNNQSCGRAFHDIQTFHSLVPGLET